MKFCILSLGIACFLLVGCDKKIEQPVFTIGALTPNSGMAGDTIVISGSNFGNEFSHPQVMFPNKKAGRVLLQSDTVIKVIAPAESASGPLTISIGDREVTTPDFNFYSLFMFGATKEISVYQATVWKDRKPVPYSSEYSSISEGVVFNGDVYAIGYLITESGAGDRMPACWKNGALMAISGTTEWTVFTGIAISNGDVYISGIDAENDRGEGNPVYWKNGDKVVLGDSDSGVTTDIQVQGSNVYVTGYDYALACYWKNGVETILSEGVDFAKATSIAVVGADTYIAGSRYDGRGSWGLVWKNGVEILLNPNENYHHYSTKSTMVSGSDVYVGGGYARYNGFDFVERAAKYWKNGVEHSIKRKGYTWQVYVLCISEYRGETFMTVSSNVFNSQSQVYKNDKAIFSSDDYRQRVLSHQVVPY